MEKRAFKLLMIATVIIGFNASGWAQEVDVGKMEFQSSCAACHGADGKREGTDERRAQIDPFRSDRARQEK